MDVLDIRELASDWRDLLAEEEASGDTDITELGKYTALCDQLGIDVDPDALEAYGDNYEPTMIATADFADYAQELADDLGVFDPRTYGHRLYMEPGTRPEDLSQRWPFTCIDWEAAADELSVDYSTVRFDGTDYYIRSV
jgi:hypothetical protein